MNKVSPTMLGILTFAAFSVAFMFGWQSVLLGLLVVIVAMIVASVEPLSSVVVAVGMLVAYAIVVDPVVAAGAGIVFATAVGLGLWFLMNRSRNNARLDRDYRPGRHNSP